MTSHHELVFLPPLPHAAGALAGSHTRGWATALKTHSVVWQMAEECSRLCPQPSHKCREKTFCCVKHTKKSPLHASTPLRSIGHYVGLPMIKTGRMDNREKNASKPQKRNLVTKQKKEVFTFLV